MSKLSSVAFAALAAATVAAFFVTQHLKVTTPLIQGAPAPSPGAINPVDGRVCAGVNHRFTRMSFYLQHRADDVDVFVVDQSGAIIRTLASDRHMRRGVRKPDGEFSWNGREDNGAIAPDGTYYFKIALRNQGRTVELSNAPINVITIPPRPVVTSVSPSLTAGGAPVTIHYSGDAGRGATVLLYRTDLPGKPKLVFFFGTGNTHTAVWNGRIHDRPAPAGTYLVGLQVTDAACNPGRFPIVLPPAPGTTPRAGVTIRYLAAQPPLTPVPAGTSALVNVDARRQAYRWTLTSAVAKAPLATGTARSHRLLVKLPPGRAGLYELALSSGPHATAVPLVASAPAGAASTAHILVVLPALTWQGRNPVDDTGDGLPDTLDAGLPIELERPLADGLPAGFADEQALLLWLDRSHRSYDLTTDLGLIEGVGPALSGHRGVVLAGSVRWLSRSLGSALRAFVQGGGRLLSLGIDALRRGVTVRGAQALHPTAPTRADALGARLGPVVSQNKDLITVISDGMGVFTGTSGAFPGFGSYQQFSSVAPGLQVLSEAGTSPSTVSIVGFRRGRGDVIDIGLVGFGSSLARRNVNTEELMSRVWTVLGG
jgi:hypothetical protein